MTLGIAVAVVHPAAVARRSSSGPEDPRSAISVTVPNSPVLGGSTVAILLQAEPHKTVQWQFGYGEDILTKGRIASDGDGLARLKLLTPNVRHRAVCRFVIPSPERPAASEEIVIYPPRMITSPDELGESLEIGVVDQTGRVQRALTAEKLAFQELRSQLEIQTFDGDMLILAAFAKPDPLTDLCASFSGRVKRGMSMLIANPPTGWKGFGIERIELPKPLLAGAQLAAGFSDIVQPADLGRGPWKVILRSGKACDAPVWIEAPAEPKSTTAPTPRPLVAKTRKRSETHLQTTSGENLWSPVRSGQKTTPKPSTRPGLDRGKRTPPSPETNTGTVRKHPVIATRSVGRGLLVVTMLPQISRPDDDAVGRAILDGLIIRMQEQKALSQEIKERSK